MGTTLLEELQQRPNSHLALTRAFEERTGLAWHAPTPAGIAKAASQTVSVVVPAHDNAYSLAAVLDALAAQAHPERFEVVVVDDASHDATADIAATHPVVDRAVRLPQRAGASAARNVGTALAGGQVALYLDADMVLPRHAVSDVATRATADAVLVGFRHNVSHDRHRGGTAVPAGPASLSADHRVTWLPPAGVTLPYSGITLDQPIEGRPLEDTRDFLDLGYGRTYYDWDLPRMVVSALVAAPRAAVLDVGGYEHGFARGWGVEDTYLGACLVADGLLVVPLRQLVGYHLDPPDAATQWKAKLASWPTNLALYRALLAEPARRARAGAFATATSALLADSTLLR